MNNSGIMDVLGPIMIGPSSSHTAGALRLAQLARAVFGGQPASARIGLHGSFAKTGLGHGTHLALVAGLTGLTVDDERLPEAVDIARDCGLSVSLYETDLGPDAHPNTAVFELTAPGRGTMRIVGTSLGGGLVRLVAVNDFAISLTGLSSTLVVAHYDRPGVIARLCSVLALYDVNIAGMNVSRKDRGGEALTVLELDGPCPEPVWQCLASSPQVSWAVGVPALDNPGGVAER
jgi:L-serine dehydratase